MIRFEDVCKVFANGTYAVKELSLEVRTGELCALVGPSGAGKTTVLRMVNRLAEPTSGHVLVDGADVATVDKVELRRRTGYVIQQGGLFPHLKVAENVATVPRLLGWGKERVRSRVNEMLELVGLDPSIYAARYPSELSGGQAQRVGVARALAGDPPVLLMDEPFGALDPIVRVRLQQEFLELQANLKKTVIFVTHDIDEAVSLGDRIAVLGQGGVLQQHATPSEVLARPATEFVAEFVGANSGLRRLAAAALQACDLDHPPVVSLETKLGEAKRAVEAGATSWAVVVDEAGGLRGWLEPALAEGNDSMSVAALVKPLGVRLKVGDSLEAAFSEMLRHDNGWVAVADGEHYLGVITPAGLHAALRRSLGGPGAGPLPEGVAGPLPAGLGGCCQQSANGRAGSQFNWH